MRSSGVRSGCPLNRCPTLLHHCTSTMKAYLQGANMPDDKSQTAADRQRISIEEDYERRDWATSLGTTEDKLRDAVQAVGNSADKVREYLRGK